MLKQSYKKVLARLLNKAYGFDLLANPAFRSNPPPVMDTLEASIAKYFMVSMAVHGMDNKRVKIKAMDCLSDLFQKDLGKTYGSKEMEEKILPRVRERLAEYTSLVLSKEEAGAKLKYLGICMVNHVMVEKPTPVEELAGGFVWYPAIATATSREIARLESQKAIRWGWI
ncbi:MAG: hypothetical protein OEW12_05570 [Deltaproteobacteria bacterium]|nr:hypothetical protein [Deltaproteobacteria bacterium]